MFVLVFCVFRKADFIQSVVPLFQQIKFDFWGHDAIVLHGHEIRKQHGDFNILLNPERRAAFIDLVSIALAQSPFIVIAAAIDKSLHVKRHAQPDNPYEIALTYCMEQMQRFLDEQGQADRTTHVLVEKRGRAEDQLLELVFRRVADGENSVGLMPNLAIRFMDKKHNSTGLQIADLIAHPVARHVIDPQQPNRAFDIVAPKLRRGPGGEVSDYGLKVFP